MARNQFFPELSSNLGEISEITQKKIKRGLQIVLAGFLLAAGSTESTPDTKTTLRDTYTSEKDLNFKGANLQINFFETGKDGKKHFNPLFLLAPISANFNFENLKNSEFFNQVLHVYAKDFKHAKATNPEDYEKKATLWEEELKTNLGEIFFGLDVTGGRQELPTGQIKVKSLHIIGMASPEGKESKGSSSIGIGKIDQENIELGKKRAGSAYSIVTKKLQDLGVNVNETSLLSAINSEELQFSDAEWSTLQRMSKVFSGKNEEQKIFNLVRAYNRGKITNSESLAILDSIIGSKRKITIQIELEGPQNILVSIPLPFLLLFLLRPFKIKDQDDAGEDEKSGEELDDDKEGDEKEKPDKEKRIYDRADYSRIPPSLATEYKHAFSKSARTRGNRGPQRALGLSGGHAGRGPHIQNNISKTKRGNKRDRMY